MSRPHRTVASVFLAVLALAATGYAAPDKAPKPQSVVGTLQKVDGQHITLQTAKGTEMVTLVSTSHIQLGAKTIEPANLSSYTGQSVKVRYVEQNGAKEAQTVTLSSAPTNAQSKPATKPAASSAKK